MNYVFTLCFNLVSEVEKSVRPLYENNRDFIHVIVDCGFPIEEDVIPDNFEIVKKRNTEKLRDLCHKYGSTYLKIQNEGVSQNWNAVKKWIRLQDNDCLIGLDPDERPQTKNWVEAMGKVLKDDIGMVSLWMTAYNTRGWDFHIENIDGTRCLFLKGIINWALIGLSGRFYNHIKEIPIPGYAPIYGYIEDMLLPYFTNYRWCLLPGHTVIHTDYELGEPGSSKLLREWKNTIIYKRDIYGQISFEQFLIMKREDKI